MLNLLRELKDLRKKGVLGMNRRNISYIGRYNERRLYPLVDNKLTSKRLAIEAGVSVPALLGVVASQHGIATTELALREQSGFCLKPAKGSGGKGIMVIRRGAEGGYLRSNGQVISSEELRRHMSNILAGLFSLGGAPDQVLVEALLECDPSLTGYSHEGVPDLRLIVFQGVPVMAMMRLACAASHGKANLHQGAVGVGISIADGRAVLAVQKDAPIKRHPDTGMDLRALQVPRWQEMLELGCNCADMTGLGYLGVDLVLDKHLGPALLELNARPGLSIQIANGAGLLPRLREVEALRNPARLSVAERIAFAQDHF
ncbi:alpha-L-glutamate ligase-like protein [Teredinibacter turnerae]|uniref:Alpha-L-glutamate ligase family protein n=1 Tax=Teredinibacter turnerae (strain ATCC 39867 / T7901) TaxID=377629 RepID=C5BNM9_TERTT|nr:alpha-L-glutamate ligase-like protein [Teredinibacter turnerae]ACR11209.1 alpha-L-glutamate ligase family protein [Teredinibacter turnerae T7901]